MVEVGGSVAMVGGSVAMLAIDFKITASNASKTTALSSISSLHDAKYKQ